QLNSQPLEVLDRQDYRRRLCNPGINHARNILEMRGVARRQRRVRGEYDTGDHRVPQVVQTALLVLGRHKVACLWGCRVIEVNDAMCSMYVTFATIEFWQCRAVLKVS